MKKIYNCLIANFAVITAIIAQPSLPIYEPFNGTLGNLAGQNGWTGSATANTAAQVVNIPLSYDGLTTLPNTKSVFYGSQTSGGTQALGFASQTGTVYASFLMQVSSIPIALGSQRYNFGFGTTTTGGTFAGCLIVMPNNTTSFELGFNGTNSNPTAGANTTAENFALNTTIMVVMAYTPGTSGAGTLSAWVNPNSASFGGTAPAPTFANIAGGNAGTVASVFIRSGAQTNPMLIDELRVGLTWADVTSYNIALPASVENFEVTTKKNTSTLSWQSTTEINFKKYEVLFSKNGTDFYSIGTVNAKGNNSKYTFNYSHTINGYFKLKLIDVDSKYSYSKTIYAPTVTLIGIKVYPNPVAEKLVIHNLPSGNHMLQIFSENGHNILAKNISATNNTIQLSNLSTGKYIVKIINNNQPIYSSVIVKK